MTKFSNIDLVIFDCDGVLVDSEPIANRVLSKYLVDFEIEQSEQECDIEYRGLSMQSMLKKIESNFNIKLPKNFEKSLQSFTYQEFEKSLTTVKGVLDQIKNLLSAGVSMCVASSGSYEKLSVTLRITQLQHIFSDKVFSSQEVDRGKPAPDLFLFAANRMSVQPERAVVVEDSFPGVEAAIAAGMPVIAYCPDYKNRAKMEEIIEGRLGLVISEMKDLLMALHRCDSRMNSMDRAD